MEEYKNIPNPYENMAGYDPIHALFLKRKQQQDNGENLPPIKQYSDDDIKALEEFCNKYGILACNFGNMHPKAALQMLKSKMGIIENNPPTKKILLKG